MSDNGIRLDKSSLQFTIVSMANFRRSTVKNAMYKSLGAAMDVYEQRVREAISLQDETLEDLAEKDHPYARRHGSLTLHAGEGGGIIRDGRHMVHKRSGAMLRALRRKTQRSPEVKTSIWFDFGVAPHARRVLEGDGTLLPRDPLWEVVQGPKTITEIRTAVVRVMGMQLRSKAMIRFGGT